MSLANLKKKEKWVAFARLMRLDRPIGIYLLLWPTLWSLWLAADGMPSLGLIVIFGLGTLLMRSAGCVINDFADREVDGHVERTHQRPIVTGEVSPKEALGLCAGLCLIAFLLVLLTNTLTVWLSLGALALAASYPFMKRYTHLPQVVLGAAFAWATPMAFAAQTNSLAPEIWLVYTTVVLWTVSYDTFYGMVDREDDLKIGVKSTAILFGEQDLMMIGALQGLTLISLVLMGQRFDLGFFYFVSLVVVAGLFFHQQRLAKSRQPEGCMQAFLNNNWVGMAIFVGVFIDKTF